VTTVTLSKGDIGVIIKPDGSIHPLLPTGARKIDHRHKALIGAAFQVQFDGDYRDKAAGAFDLYHTPTAGEA
jgi:hypothetical protein